MLGYAVATLTRNNRPPPSVVNSAGRFSTNTLRLLKLGVRTPKDASAIELEKYLSGVKEEVV